MASTTKQKLLDCPVCGEPIEATVQIELGAIQVQLPESPINPAAKPQIEVPAVLTGLRVSHDCIPPATR